MPRFHLVEIRASKHGYLIEAASGEDAREGRFELLEEAATDDWAERTVSLEQVADDETEPPEL